MIINWYGQSCFKIQSGNLVIYTDPFDKAIGLTPPRGHADIVTVSHNHYDHNNVQLLSDEPFVINSPGEYEVKGVYLQGISSFHDKKSGEERGSNIIFVIDMEGIKIGHLGDLGQNKLTPEQLEEINGIDILMIPVGGIYTINGKEAAEIVNQVEPKIVIPMHYKIKGLNIKLGDASDFLEELGASKNPALDKLTIKKKDLPQETEVIVMKL